MNRIHLFEWEDQEWFPKSWRDFGTDYLRFIALKFNIYDSVIPLIKRGILASGKEQWVDCASGGGAGLVKIAKKLKEELPGLQVTLTDYYPNIKAFERTKAADEQLFHYETEPVDATHLPEKLHGPLRSLFGAFHHFRPGAAQKILQDAVDSKSPIAVFEPVGRNAVSWFSMLFVIPNVLIFAPFIRPLRWQVFPFIYLLPLIPLYILWDGCVSILRTYSKKELHGLIEKLDNADSFHWEIGSKTGQPAPVYYLTGTPKEGG